MEINELHQLFLKHSKVSTDSRNIKENGLFFALKGPNFNGNKFAKDALKKGASYAIIDEVEFKFSDRTILVNDVLKTLQQLATFHRNHCKVKIISLTGSNGKTTTKELIYTVLSKKYKTIATQGNLNNHIGVPLTLLSIKEDTEIAVVEMGANHQKEIAFLSEIAQPDFGYITNFGKAHLEGFGGIEGVIKGKSELYDYLLTNDKYVFLNADDSIQKEKLSTYIKKFGFSQNDHQYFNIQLLGADPYVKLKFENITVNTHLIGAYNFTNCCAAIVMGKYFNVAPEAIKKALETYQPQNNRSQIIEQNGHEIILDAYNANPSSMEAALTNFSKGKVDNKVVFLGDMFELGDSAEEEHQSISDLASKLGFKLVFLVGENFSKTKTDHKSYTSFEEFKNSIDLTTLPKSQILIKGSRGMAMERILDLL